MVDHAGKSCQGIYTLESSNSVEADMHKQAPGGELGHCLAFSLGWTEGDSGTSFQLNLDAKINRSIGGVVATCCWANIEARTVLWEVPTRRDFIIEVMVCIANDHEDVDPNYGPIEGIQPSGVMNDSSNVENFYSWSVELSLLQMRPRPPTAATTMVKSRDIKGSRM